MLMGRWNCDVLPTEPGRVNLVETWVGSPARVYSKPRSVCEPGVFPKRKRLSASAIRVSNCLRNSLSAVSGVGSRRAQKSSMNAFASASVFSDAQYVFSCFIMR